MHIGYIVGTMIAVLFIICGCIAAILAKKNQKRSKWAMWTIFFGFVALISAVVNYNLFGK